MSEFSASELEALNHIITAMNIIQKDWGLHQGSNLSYELCLHVHGMQGFVLQHYLQRTMPGVGGEWYESDK